MSSPETFYPQPVGQDGAQQQQQNQQKFVNDAYDVGARRTASNDVDPNQRSRVFDGRGLFGQRDNRRGGDQAGAALENEGGIKSLKLPKGFTNGAVEREDNYMEFPSGANNGTKVCYQRRSDFAATDDDIKRMNDVMKKPPHNLSEQEILDLMPCMAPGRWAGTANFKQLGLRTEDVAGKRVISGDFQFKDQDKKLHVIIANPDKEKHQIEVLWMEGPGRDFDRNRNAVINSINHMQWTDTPAPANNHRLFRR